MAKIQAIFRQMKSGDGVDLYAYCRQSADRSTVIRQAIKELLPDFHEVMDKGKRPDKLTFVPTGEKDENGKDKVESKLVPISRAPLAVQKYIIQQKASFASGSGVELKPTKDKSVLFDNVYRNWTDNKLMYDLKDIFERIMGETQCAIIFYGDSKESSLSTFRFRHKIISPTLGDKLEPVFDEDTGDLIAFGREYNRGKNVRYDLYIMNEQGFCEIHRFINGKPLMVDVFGDDGVTVTGQEAEIIKTPFTKLPVIYGEQLFPECWDTRHLMREFENSFNDFLTQQGYTGDPILWIRSGSVDMPAVGSQGKVLMGTGEKDEAKFLTPENATESRNLQFNLSTKFMFGLNRSVMMDAQTMSDMKADSGEALKRMLTDVYMEAEDKQNGYLGKFTQRIINWLTNEWRTLLNGADPDLRVSLRFIPKSFSGEAERIAIAQSAEGLATLETRVSMAGLEDDVARAVEMIKSENI